MKARARCLCPKPEGYMMRAVQYGKYMPVPFFGNSPNLHFKNATTECSRCGVPLCEGCMVIVIKDYTDIRPDYPIISKELCPVCVEEAR